MLASPQGAIPRGGHIVVESLTTRCGRAARPIDVGRRVARDGGPRQRDGERGALPRLTGDGDRAAVGLDDLGADREAEAGTLAGPGRIGAIKALKEEGMKVPDDIGIMGFDDIYMSSIVEPPLTTVKQPNYEMGYRAAELLINAIESENRETAAQAGKTDTIILDTELTIRKSVKDGKGVTV